MIASQKIGKSFMGALKYNWNKLVHPDPELRAKLLSTNFTSMDFAMIKREVDLVRSLRPSLGRYVYHTSLNFHKDDVLDNKTLLAIAEDYLRLSGYTSNQYFIFRHHDAEHPHLHLLVNRITFDGEVVSDSNNFKKSDAIVVKLEQQYNLVKVKHRIHVPVEQSRNVAEYSGSRRTVEQGKAVANDQQTCVTVDRKNNVANEQGSGITIDSGGNVPILQYNKSPLRAPTKSELEMILRTRMGSDKMVLQDKLLQLVSGPGISLQDFISKCEEEGIHLLFNQASTGRVSGVTYFHGGFKVKGQSLGNRFKWAELTKTVDYEQGRDGQAIRQANERTRGLYGDYTTGLHNTTGRLGSTAGVTTPDAGELFQQTGNVETHRSYAEQTGAAADNNGAANHSSGQDTGTGASVDKEAGRYGDWRDYAGGYIPDIEISDDIDDEAILGRNRRRQKQARTNTR